MTVGIRQQPYNDRMGQQRRQAAWRRRVVWTLVLAGLGTLATWAFFFSSWFAVTAIHVVGVNDSLSQGITQSVRELLSARRLYIFQPARNILLLNTGAVAEHIVSEHPVINEAVVTKKYPNGLEISVTERAATGIWCHGQECEFWDRTGARWGSAVPSIGPLLLLVEDERSDRTLDAKMLFGFLKVIDGLPELGLVVRSLKFPDAEPGGLHVRTNKKYEIYFDVSGDVADQLAVLGVFLADRAKDPAFAPGYIDLRTPGRVYYK